MVTFVTYNYQMEAAAREREAQEVAKCTFKPDRVTKKKAKGGETKRDFNKLYNDLLSFQLRADEKKL